MFWVLYDKLLGVTEMNIILRRVLRYVISHNHKVLQYLCSLENYPFYLSDYEKVLSIVASAGCNWNEYDIT